ncbi:CDP-glycerol glycerophosphotransferase family protein [Mumia sp. ZJ430]|uniref:CDP-glycerol glycerophosphotransferase family protein n=1 Tax=Mumia sp. ZJ430 TaxID=2708083 RepID=UPI00141F57FC|nr:CDP-glycerol glycerophosphotransferase family protein [Mumia sp. ZJ430]
MSEVAFGGALLGRASWSGLHALELRGRLTRGGVPVAVAVKGPHGDDVFRADVTGSADAFVATLDLTALNPVPRRWWRRPALDGPAQVLVVVEAGGRRHELPWEARPRGAASRRLSWSGAQGGLGIRLRWDDEAGLIVQSESCGAVLREVRVDGDALVLDVEGTYDALGVGGLEGAGPTRIAVRDGAGQVSATDVPDGSSPLWARRRRTWEPVTWAVGHPVTGATAHGLRLDAMRDGRVRLSAQPAMLADAVEVTGGGSSGCAVVVRGRSVGQVERPSEMWMIGPHRRFSASISWDGDRFSVRLPLEVTGWYGEPSTPPSGRYDLAFDQEGERLLKTTPYGLPDAPVRGVCDRWSAAVQVTTANRVTVEVESPLRLDERAPALQRALHDQYRATSPSPLRIAYFECYSGSSATDAARAIHDELRRRGSDLELVWGLQDWSVPVPEGGRGVVRFSREWWDVVSTASYQTYDAAVPAQLERRPGQTILQTWHGTPFKRLGSDRGVVRANQPRYQEAWERAISRWDVLLSQNPWSTEVFRRAWNFEGPILELGYPRNDVLALASDDDEAVARVRLGLNRDDLVVLYAPTVRDGDRVMPMLLDVERVAAALGPGVTVLVRGHMLTRRWAWAGTSRSIVDVTDYPEINDLFLAADATITDYSSIMFDFSVTGKSLVFFAPDLEDYRDRRRGTYFDLAERGPGPVASTTEEVVAALADLESVRARYAERYAAWRTTYNPRDDGHAAARVVDAVFDGG